jgi:hypothetical protein
MRHAFFVGAEIDNRFHAQGRKAGTICGRKSIERLGSEQQAGLHAPSIGRDQTAEITKIWRARKVDREIARGGRCRFALAALPTVGLPPAGLAHRADGQGQHQDRST